jgi:anaphase-promoting complex subunit 8
LRTSNLANDSLDYDTAESTFAQILQSDPLRLDYLEAYSNILFVMDKRPRLAFVAQVATSTDRFRPETCLAVGNYFARGSDHEKAIVYFRRALTLDRSYQAAWTLMGHEYLELRNTHAAVECYRRAIDINRKDFRAWYGLGQAYEFLEMHLYALHYFQQAAALSFPDAKIWQANGQCLDRLGRYQQAIKAYKRALLAGIGEDSPGAGRNKERPQYLDPEVTWLIAMDYDKLNDEKQIRHWLELTIAQEEGMLQRAEAESQSVFGASQSMAHSVMSTRTMAEEEDEKASGGTGVTATTSRARMWLARLEYVRATDQSMKRALQLANELCSDGYEVEEAKSLMKEIRARMGERWSNEVDREYME